MQDQIDQLQIYKQPTCIMEVKSICPLHDLTNSFVCLSETCKNRIGCQICIKKHKHKYFLDDAHHSKLLTQIGDDISQKLKDYSTYKKANILNLQLLEYRDQIIQSFQNEEIYLQSKITQDTLNFTLEMQRTSERITEVMNLAKNQILNCWQKYYSESMKYYHCEQEVQKIDQHYKNIQISTSTDVQQPVTFLYSQQIYLKFNLQLDSLKSEIAHYQKHTRQLTEWLEKMREQYKKMDLFDLETFQKWRSLYDTKLTIPSFIEQKTQFASWQNRFLAKNQEENPSYKDVVQYKLRYQTLRPVHRMSRIDNQKFASSGSRALDIWNRVSYHPMKSIPLEYCSYGLTSFSRQDGTTKLLFGLSNGDLCEIDPSSYLVSTIKGHMGAIKQIVQYKPNIFLTASQDWLIKIWNYNKEPNLNEFASVRSTMNGHSGKLNTLQIIQDYVISGGTDGTIKLWDINKLVVEEVYEQQREIHALTKIREQLFASGGQIRQIRFWDYRIPKTAVSKYGIELFNNSILRVDQNRLLFNDRNILKMVDLKKLDKPLLIYKQQQAFSGTIGDITYLGDKEIGTGGADNFIVVWKC